MWNSEIGRVIAEDFGVDAWTAKGATVRRKYGAEEGDFDKNCLFIGYRLIEAWEQNKKSASLEKLCKVIIDFALGARQPPASAAPAEAVQ